MRKGFSTSINFAALVAASVMHAAVAAPTLRTDPATAVPPNGSFLEQIYYYHGRHYQYHYNGKYYAHRVYRHGRWQYY
jgi:hypothetical protein